MMNEIHGCGSGADGCAAGGRGIAGVVPVTAAECSSGGDSVLALDDCAPATGEEAGPWG